MNSDDAADSDPTTVRGERDIASVNRARSVQSRVSSVLAMGLMTALGLGTLTWYYANAMMRQTRARQSAQALSTNKAQGEMALPSLGRIDQPVPGPASTLARSAEPPSPPPQGLTASSWLSEAPVANGGMTTQYGPPPAKTPGQLTVERELSGVVFAQAPSANSAAAASLAEANSLAGAASLTGATSSAGAGSWSGSPPGLMPTQDAGGLPALLRPSLTTAVTAQVLPTTRLLLPKGAFIDCTLETAIDSTLPGMTTCVTATDTFGVDGKVVLLERGTKLVGETRGQVQQGAARVFVLWTEARTPTGVIVPLASPGTDELGRSGLPGSTNRHFWQRFGAAMLVSMVDGAVQAAVQSSRNGGGAVIYSPSSSQDVMTEVLKGTVNIPPTVVKPQGDRIQVLVARDLDFRSVYELRPAAGR
jgi:type IV secretion system protein VirB10